jgi:hypothetical protein
MSNDFDKEEIELEEDFNPKKVKSSLLELEPEDELAEPVDDALLDEIGGDDEDGEYVWDGDEEETAY